jgi:hypothetical protein
MHSGDRDEMEHDGSDGSMREGAGVSEERWWWLRALRADNGGEREIERRKIATGTEGGMVQRSVACFCCGGWRRRMTRIMMPWNVEVSKHSGEVEREEGN